MAALLWRKEKVTKRIYVDRHHNNQPIGKEDGVILVNWVFGVFFVDRTMLMSKTILFHSQQRNSYLDSKCVLFHCLNKHVSAEEIVALLLVLPGLLNVYDACRSFNLWKLDSRQQAGSQ